MPAAPHNLIASVLEWEIPNSTPPLRPVSTRRATPYPTIRNANSGAAARRFPPIPALPWYGVGGVLEREVQNEELEVPALPNVGEEDTTAAVAALSLDMPPTFSAGGHTEEEHPSRAQKRRARRKRAKDTASKLRRSSRLMAKEEPSFEMPEDKCGRTA